MAQMIKFNLSEESILGAVKKLRMYAQELDFKTSKLIQTLASNGIKVINANKYTDGDSDSSDIHAWLESNSSSGISKVTLIMHGKDVAFIEFGAGITFNGSAGSSPNPKGQELGMTIGSYGYGQGKNESWKYYNEQVGDYIISYGTKAAMPMYKAEKEIIRTFLDVAKKVFK